MTANLLLLQTLTAYAAEAPRDEEGNLTPQAQEGLRRIAALADDPEAMAELEALQRPAEEQPPA